MPTEIKLWHIDDEHPKPILRDRLNLESRLENWLKYDISLISNDLLVIGQQVQEGLQPGQFEPDHRVSGLDR